MTVNLSGILYLLVKPLVWPILNYSPACKVANTLGVGLIACSSRVTLNVAFMY